MDPTAPLKYQLKISEEIEENNESVLPKVYVKDRKKILSSSNLDYLKRENLAKRLKKSSKRLISLILSSNKHDDIPEKQYFCNPHLVSDLKDKTKGFYYYYEELDNIGQVTKHFTL